MQYTPYCLYIGIIAKLNTLGVFIALTWFDIASGYRPPGTLLFE